MHRVMTLGTKRWAMLLSIVVAAAMSGSAQPARGEGDDANYLFSRINDVRDANGLAELPRDPSLDQVAQSWAERMAPGGSRQNPNLEDEAPPSGRQGEVVGDGANPEVIFQSWANGATSSSVLFDEGFDAVGIGVTWYQGKLYAVADFTAPQPQPAVPAAEGESEGGPTGTPLDDIINAVLSLLA